MQIIQYTPGIWDIEAKMQEARASNRLAIISALAGKDGEAIKSKHVVVFEHAEDCEAKEGAKTHALRVVVNGH